MCSYFFPLSFKNGNKLDEYIYLLFHYLNYTLRVRLVREFWRGGAGRGGEIFNLKCLVQFLEGEGSKSF